MLRFMNRAATSLLVSCSPFLKAPRTALTSREPLLDREPRSPRIFSFDAFSLPGRKAALAAADRVRSPWKLAVAFINSLTEKAGKMSGERRGGGGFRQSPMRCSTVDDLEVFNDDVLSPLSLGSSLSSYAVHKADGRLCLIGACRKPYCPPPTLLMLILSFEVSSFPILIGFANTRFPVSAFRPS